MELKLTPTLVPADPKLQSKTITANGTYTADSGYDGIGIATVNVQPTLQDKSVTENGTVTADDDYDGLASVTVDVQPTLETLEATENGTYSPSEGVDGFSSVTVNVGGDEQVFLSDDCAYLFGVYKGGNVNEGASDYTRAFRTKLYTAAMKLVSGTGSILNATHMFTSYGGTSIPFTINFDKECTSVAGMFGGCRYLTTLPTITNTVNVANWGEFLNGCHAITEYDNNYDMTAATNLSYSFQYMSKLKKAIITNIGDNHSCSYTSIFEYDSSLEEVELAIPCNYAITSNCFSSGAFKNCTKLSSLKFKTNDDGSARVSQLKSLTIEMNRGPSATIYTHDSAVETIKTLPDCSEYLATAGGTNTIQFLSAVTSSLTTEEIAIATSKGWTVA